MGNKVSIKTTIIEGNVPWLIGKETLEKIGAVIDFEKGIVIAKRFSDYIIPCKGKNEKHLKISLIKKMEPHKMWLGIDREWWTNKEIIGKRIEKLHLQFGHASSGKLIGICNDAYKKNEEYQRFKKTLEEKIIDIVGKCDTCIKYKKTPARPIVGMPMAKHFNEVVALDLGEIENRRFLMMVDLATNYCQAAWIKDKNPLTVVKAFMGKWLSVLGTPRKILSDNGLESVSYTHLRAHE